LHTILDMVNIGSCGVRGVSGSVLRLTFSLEFWLLVCMFTAAIARAGAASMMSHIHALSLLVVLSLLFI
jgi:hypothetical protein